MFSLLAKFQEFTTVSTEDLNLDKVSTFSPEQNVTRSHKSSNNRRKRYSDDSDQDYEPPSSSSLRLTRKAIKLVPCASQWDSDNFNSDDEEMEVRKARRGRPPKRSISVSSDSSKDCDAVRYRELRDKNNEASRRSRLKRKMKEMSLEKEAVKLEKENIQLKTQVEELEKTVNNFRNSLFKIMLSK